MTRADGSPPTSHPGVHPTWRTIAVGLAAGVAAYAAVGWHHDRAERAAAVPAVREVAPDDPRVERLLDAVDLDHVRLDDALAHVARQADLNLLAHLDGLPDDGPDRPVTLHLRRVTFATAIDAVLGPGRAGSDRFAWAERGGVVAVAPQSQLDQDPTDAPVVRVYDVRPLLDQWVGPPPPPPPSGNESQNLFTPSPPTLADEYERRGDELKALIENNADPTSWKDNGGDAGSMQLWAGQLIVTQRERGHRAVEAFLQLLRLPGRPAAEAVPAARPVVPIVADPHADRVLEAVDFDHVRVSDAAVALARQADVNLMLRPGESGAAKLGATVTAHLRHATFAAALDALLDPTDKSDDRLGWVERDGTVTVAGQDWLDHDPAAMVVRVYDVRATLGQLAPPQGTTSDPGQWPRNDDRGDRLAQLLTTHVVPDTWLVNGGDGTISSWAGELVVSQTDRNQRAVAAFLAQLKRRPG